MNSKMTTSSQLSTTEPKKNKNKNKLSKQLPTTTGTEPQKWRSHGGLSVGRGWRMGEKVQGIMVSTKETGGG